MEDIIKTIDNFDFNHIRNKFSEFWYGDDVQNFICTQQLIRIFPRCYELFREKIKDYSVEEDSDSDDSDIVDIMNEDDKIINTLGILFKLGGNADYLLDIIRNYDNVIYEFLYYIVSMYPRTSLSRVISENNIFDIENKVHFIKQCDLIQGAFPKMSYEDVEKTVYENHLKQLTPKSYNFVKDNYNNFNDLLNQGLFNKNSYKLLDKALQKEDVEMINLIINDIEKIELSSKSPLITNFDKPIELLQLIIKKQELISFCGYNIVQFVSDKDKLVALLKTIFNDYEHNFKFYEVQFTRENFCKEAFEAMKNFTGERLKDFIIQLLDYSIEQNIILEDSEFLDYIKRNELLDELRSYKFGCRFNLLIYN